MVDVLRKWKPGVRRERLFVIAGFVWGVAAGALLLRGYSFLPDSPAVDGILGCVSIVIGLLFFRLMFRRILHRNVKRIHDMQLEQPCAFSFQSWRSYGLMSLMISLGIAVRLSGLVPPAELGTVYVAMAVPLGISSVQLFREGLSHKK
jgi:hypothetical protein